jgi:phage tail-like protein
MSFENEPLPVHMEGDFLVQIPGMVDLKFEKCSEIKGTIAQIKRTMGGEVRPRKWPGNVEYADVTLEKAATSDPRLRQWFQQCKDAIANRGLNSPEYFKEVSVVRFAPDKVTILKRTILHNAFPVEFDEGGHDSENKNPSIEKLVLAFWEPETIIG